MDTIKAVPQLRQLVTGFSPLQPRFNPRCGNVRILMDKMALGQVFSKYFSFFC
jgi:hypothetical protein